MTLLLIALETQGSTGSRSRPQSGCRNSLSGTGPFRVARWEAGKAATLTAHERHWKGRPYLDSIEIQMGRTPRDQARICKSARPTPSMRPWEARIRCHIRPLPWYLTGRVLLPPYVKRCHCRSTVQPSWKLFALAHPASAAAIAFYECNAGAFRARTS